jgi:cytochrome c oxidase assembly protein subunit 11
MGLSKKNYIIFFLFFIFVLIFFISVYELNKQKEKAKSLEPIVVNLLTSVHPNLTWTFKPVEPVIIIKPGEVITVEYLVENLSAIDATGIATFSYFPNEFGSYISKLNCFCYDAQTLKAKQTKRYSLVLLIDPEVTKDSKTKNVKEVTMQFTFFDYKEFKKNKS